MAVEIDPLALGFAAENGRRHGGAESMDFVEADVLEWLREPPAEPFDIIAANLFSELLGQVFPLLKRWIRPGGRLIVSGFLATQDEPLRKAAAKSGFQFGRGLRRGKWVAASGAV